MRALCVPVLVLVASVSAAGEPDPIDPRLKQALERTNGIPDFASLSSATIHQSKKGWIASWAHPVGDSGQDECTATFSPDGALESQRCRVEYVTHSMGPGNARWISIAEWTFDASGKLTRFKGTQKSVLLTTNKVGVNKAYTQPDDELLADMCKPLLKLDESLRR